MVQSVKKSGAKIPLFYWPILHLAKSFYADEKQRYLGGKRGAFPKIRNSPKKAKRPQNPPKIKKKSDISQNKAAKSPSIGFEQSPGLVISDKIRGFFYVSKA